MGASSPAFRLRSRSDRGRGADLPALVGKRLIGGPRSDRVVADGLTESRSELLYPKYILRGRGVRCRWWEG